MSQTMYLWYLLIAVVLIELAIIVAFFVKQRLDALARLAHDQSSEIEALRGFLTQAEPTTAADIETFERSDTAVDPAVPEELVSALSANQCVLFAGPGLSASIGLPTRHQFIERLLVEFQIDEETQRAVRQLIASRDYDTAIEFLSANVERSALIRATSDMVATPQVSYPQLFEDLAACNFCDVITINWDDLMEGLFADRAPVVLTGGSSDDFERAIHPESFSIVKLRGALTDPQTVRYTTLDLATSVSSNSLLSRYITSLFSDNCVFFVGMSRSAIEQFFAVFPRLAASKYSHFALLPYSSRLKISEQIWASRFSLKTIAYNATDGHPELLMFVRDLRRRLEQVNPAVPGRGLKRNVGELTVQRLLLENIGPFTSLDLEFGRGWNIFLGDNGSGKSTILRAIALGLCGNDPEAIRGAQRLLNVGASYGSIELHAGNGRYKTTLSRGSDGRVLLETPGLTPLSRGNWCVLGFPPLRGISVNPPKGASSQGPSKPNVYDVLPILLGSTDSRTDSLKQWIVNLDVSASNPDPQDAFAGRASVIRDAFFSILSRLLPGAFLGFSRVDHSNWDVLVRTTDGEVSIDQVSQGMTSLLGWIGTTLQRMYEVYPRSDFPHKEPALLLVDELDAHLHPAWQRVIVSLVKENFGDLQVVGTTHSPLVIAGMGEEEIYIAQRANTSSAPQVSRAPHGFDGLRADQILTSEAFSLPTTRSVDDEKRRTKYTELLAKDSLTAEELQDREDLEEYIGRAFVGGETIEERDTNALQSEQATSVANEFDAFLKNPEIRKLFGNVEARSSARTSDDLQP